MGYTVTGILPQRHYELLLTMDLVGHEEDVRVRAALPPLTDRQEVKQETFGAPDFTFRILQDGPNRWGTWEKVSARGSHTLTYAATVRTKAIRFAFPDSLPIPSLYPPEIAQYLLPTKTIQSDSPEIENLFGTVVPPEHRSDAATVIRDVYAFVSESIKGVPLKGTTDALTALRLGEGACGGKSRLLAALMRAGGIPARLVGGLIMKDGHWRSSHIWVEAYLGNRWVPFDALNSYFAQVPSHYLILYYGDYPLFTYTRDINFRYQFLGRKILAPPEEAMNSLRTQPAGMLNLWSAFQQVRIPLNLLKIILMIPFGALVVVLARNLVGIQTFGTFMPALMAVAFRDTGLLWGLVLFTGILLFGGGVRFLLERLQLLHTPRLAVMLTATVIFMMAITVLGVATGRILPTRVSLFPIVILTLTVERFAIILEEEGPRKTFTVVVGTAVVVAAAYLVMSFEPLQIVVVTFPELLLLPVVAFIILGRWPGMRLLEYLRFRHLYGGRGLT